MSGGIENVNYAEILIPVSKPTSSQAFCWIFYVPKVSVYQMYVVANVFTS